MPRAYQIAAAFLADNFLVRMNYIFEFYRARVF
jgi:hypothetical protein